MKIVEIEKRPSRDELADPDNSRFRYQVVVDDGNDSTYLRFMSPAEFDAAEKADGVE